MNLIQQLQQTPKWKEFEEWYNQQEDVITLHNPTCYCQGDCLHGCVWLVDLPVMYQKGVFEKFIESQGFQLEQNSDGQTMKYTIWSLENGYEYQKNLEELLIWYFNN